MSQAVHIPRAGLGRNQAARTALSLAALMGVPLHLGSLTDDASLRPSPGSGPGIVTLAAALAQITQGTFEKGGSDGELLFHPAQKPQAGEYSFNVAHQEPNAAPVANIIDALVLPLAAAKGPTTVFLAGGTHVPTGPTGDEVAFVLCPNWQAAGVEVEYSEIVPGFLPIGGGEVQINVEPTTGLQTIQAEDKFQFRQVGVEVLVSSLPNHLGEQALDAAANRLELHGLPSQGSIRRAKGDRGVGLLIWGQGARLRAGYSSLGNRGGRPGGVGITAAEKVVTFLKSNTALTAEVVTSLLPLMAAARGVSRLLVDRMTQELNAAVQAVNALLPGATRVMRASRKGIVQIRVHGQGLL